jgi:hypothetical protein
MGSIPIGSTKEKSHPFGVAFLFGMVFSRWESNKLNATVRRTVARSRLDGIDTLISSIPIGSTQQGGISYWYYIQSKGIEQFKCNSPVDCCSIPARRDRHLDSIDSHRLHTAHSQNTQSFHSFFAISSIALHNPAVSSTHGSHAGAVNRRTSTSFSLPLFFTGTPR